MMPIIIASLIICYFIAGYFFIRALLWFCQDPDLLSVPQDPPGIKACIWCLALIVWPSYLFDLSGALLDRRSKRHSK